MCIAAIAWQLFDDLPLVLLSNRDEFFERPTTPLHSWSDKPIVAGRDDKSGGTWLGIHQDKNGAQNGRFAAVLNFRDGVQANEFQRSRGDLVSDFLQSELSPMAFARAINLTDFAGFNLIIGDSGQAVLVNNRGYPPTPLHSGLHVISNGQIDDAWFKTERLRGRIRQELLPVIAENFSDIKTEPNAWQDIAFNILSDATTAPVNQLPDTGIDKTMEEALSSIFIEPMTFNFENKILNYGTRTQSLLMIKLIKGQPKAELISKDFN